MNASENEDSDKVGPSESQESGEAQNLNLEFESGDFFDKNLVSEYAHITSSYAEPPNTQTRNGQHSQQPVSVDLRQNFRLSNWVRGNDAKFNQDEESPERDDQRSLCLKRNENQVVQDRFKAASDFWESEDGIKCQTRKWKDRDSDEAEEMRRKVQKYDENYRDPNAESDPMKSYSQLMYKKAALPPNAVASLYGTSSKSLGGVVKRDFRIPVAAATVFRSEEQSVVKQADVRPSLRQYFCEDGRVSGGSFTDLEQYNINQSRQKTLSDVETRSDSVSAFSRPKCDTNSETKIGDDENDSLCKLEMIIEKEILQVKHSVAWDDLAGLEKEKASLKELVVWPMLRPDLFKGIRAPSRGLLLYGPPGTGKTLIGRCIASQAKATFFNVSAASLTSKWLGESEKLVRTLFQVANRRAPSVIFLDEVDSLMCQRTEGEHESTRRIKNEFLQQLDGTAIDTDDRLLLIGATNRPHELDAAARRRFVRRIYVPLPEKPARQKIIEKLLHEQSHNLSADQIEQIAQKTENYSCADVTNLCKEAALGPLRSLDNIETVSFEEIPPITNEHFEKALQAIGVTVSVKDVEMCRNFHDQFGYNK